MLLLTCEASTSDFQDETENLSFCFTLSQKGKKILSKTLLSGVNIFGLVISGYSNTENTPG